MIDDKKPKNPPAFPRPVGSFTHTYNNSQRGMPLRDWFAGKALAGHTLEMHLSGNPRILAEYCYKLADAMLKERDKA